MMPKTKKKLDDYTYEVSRYSPRIKGILQDSVSGVLDTSAFSTVKGTGTGISSAPTSAKTTPVSLRQKATMTAPISAHNSSSSAMSGSILSRSVVLFVIGGVTYSEIRSAYEVAEATKREVYIGNLFGLFHMYLIFSRWYTHFNATIIH
jgi:syntaxin-binding protein 1